MKNQFFSNIKNFMLAMLLFSMFSTSCSHFLDVVPDNVLQFEDLFASRNQAINVLGMLYCNAPSAHRDLWPWTMGDEWVITSSGIDLHRDWIQGAAIMRGAQSASNTLLSYWTGTNTYTSYSLYVTIRDCDLFIQNVDHIPDMNAMEKANWKGQAIFLKAYYMFMLLKTYGPVIIPTTADPDDLNSDLFLFRSKVEECFDYILNLMDEAIPLLKGKAGVFELGQVDQVTAKAIKARVLLQRASPFYNGNAEYYSNFLDHNDEHFFAQTEDREKWKIAAEAAQEALDACEQWGFRLFHYQGRPYAFDTTDYRLNRERMQILYDLRLRYPERWNEELIWGVSHFQSMNTLGDMACIRNPPSYGGPAPPMNQGGLQPFGCASYQVMARYYTKHGLPLNEDRTVNLNTLHEIVNTPDLNSSEYESMRGYVQPGVSTVNMYLNREPRFYADLGITGGYYRSHQIRIRTMMFQNTDGGYNPTYDIESWGVLTTGIAVQKVVHPEEYFSFNVHTQRNAPVPIIRVADLYLMKAEALNEYYGPTPEVFAAINAVRLRAGIPTVEESYTNRDWVTDDALNKHLEKEGMREIILNERANEFAFEFAHRFWDMQRWKYSVSQFSYPIYGWNYLGLNAETFFQQTIIQGRKWSITDCLWPIDNREIERNANLIQNPGW